MSLRFTKIVLLCKILLISVYGFSQDTLTLMHYNLLNYGNYTTYCTTSNNNADQKDGWIKTIFNYANADIITVNEMATGVNWAQRLLDNTLNNGGVNYYARAGYQNFSGGDLANMLFYDTRKLVLHSQNAVPTSVRDFNFYTFYYRIPAGMQLSDTAFFTCIVCHLKAGSSASDAGQRASLTQTLMTYLSSNGLSGNYFLMGDFNVYTFTEQAWKNLTQHSNVAIRFYDPIGKEGAWNENPAFAAFHTQSTSNSGSGCKAGGGLDDRFDFILTSNDILQGNRKYKYISGSYTTIGNDGLHFNTSLTAAPVNTSVPAAVLTALASNSDHLPVLLKVRSDALLNVESVKMPSIQAQVFPNPAADYVEIDGIESGTDILQVQVFTLTGSLISTEMLRRGEMGFEWSVAHLPEGVFILSLASGGGTTVVHRKLIIRR